MLQEYTEQSLLQGYTPLPMQQCLYALTQKHKSTPWYTRTDFLYILGLYDRTAQLVNIHPLLAVAQMIKETAWCTSFWSRRPQRNPAGLGVTGEISKVRKDTPDWVYNKERVRWEKGLSFSDWKYSVNAHLAHLLTYMYTDSQLSPAQQHLLIYDVRAHLVTQRGHVHVLHDLDGKWNASATSKYGASIAAIANTLSTIQIV